MRRRLDQTVSMAYAQSSLQVEIQILRDTLSVSKKKAIRYAQTSASFCHIC